MPPEILAKVSAPVRSVMVISVLLKDEKIWAMPHFHSAIYASTLGVLDALSGWPSLAIGEPM
jgi:hypothetical protein